MKLCCAVLLTSFGVTVGALDIGVYFSLTGGFANDMQQSYDGLTAWRDYVNTRWGGVPLSNGTVIPINFIFRDDQSNVTLATRIWKSFVDMGLTIVIGGHTSMTVAAANFFEPYGVINIACCTAPDEVYTVNPHRWLLGIFRSSEDYPKGLLNQLHVRGMNNVAILYNDASAVTITTADSAESFATNIGMQVISKASYVGTGYTNLNCTGGQQITAQIAALQRLNQNKTDFALFAISLGLDGNDVARAVAQQNLQVTALFITIAPTNDAFPSLVGAAAAEYVFAPAQWHNSMKFTDPIMNSSSDFSRMFLSIRGYPATYLAAGGAAAGVVLQLALQAVGTTDPAVLMETLRELRADTFFGPIAFNRYQRNYAGSIATIEILDSVSRAVLPDEAAQELIVFPPSRKTLARCPDPTYTNFTKCFASLQSQDAPAAQPAYWVIAVVLVPLLTILAVAGFHLRAKLALAVRPIDATQPFAVMFVGVYNMSDLNDILGEGTAKVTSNLATMIRKSVRDHECFEARRIDESTVMITAKQPDNAIACAAAVLEQVEQARWESVATPRESVPQNPPKRAGSSSMGSSSRMARQSDRVTMRSSLSRVTRRERKASRPHLQVGVHYGFGNIDYDEESNTVSYHGAVVERAAAVTDAAVGDQILVSLELVNALDGELADANMKLNKIGTFRPKRDDTATAVMFAPVWMTDAMVDAVEGTVSKKRVSEVGGSITAALQQANAGLSLRRVAVAVVDVPWLTEALEATYIACVANLCEELEAIAMQHRAEVLSSNEGQLIFALNAGTATSMPIVRAASVALECVQHCSLLNLAATAGVGVSMCAVGRNQGRVTAFGTAVTAARAGQQVAKAAGVPVVLADTGYEDVASRFHVMTVGVMVLPSGSLGRAVAVMEALEEEQGDREWLYAVGNVSAAVAANERAWELIIQGSVPSSDLLHTMHHHDTDDTKKTSPEVFNNSRKRMDAVLDQCVRDGAIATAEVSRFIQPHANFFSLP